MVVSVCSVVDSGVDVVVSAGVVESEVAEESPSFTQEARREEDAVRMRERATMRRRRALSFIIIYLLSGADGVTAFC